ncbi:MAG: hypothetical protein H7296_07310 [Bacteroidia bacterium]|nr:hypothetical protein [Bacteroidia bacterium]
MDQKISKFIPTTPNALEIDVTNSSEQYATSIFIKKYWFITTKLSISISPKLSSVYNEYTNHNFVDNPAWTDAEKNRYTIDYNWNHVASIAIGASYFIKPKLAVQVQTTAMQFNYKRGEQSFDFFNKMGVVFGVNYYFKRII